MGSSPDDEKSDLKSNVSGIDELYVMSVVIRECEYMLIDLGVNILTDDIPILRQDAMSAGL